MPNYIAGVDPFLNNDFTEYEILRFISPTTSTTSSEIPEGTYEWEIMEVPIIHDGRPGPSSRIIHASVDIPIVKKKRDEFSEIERICKYPHNDKQIEL